MFNLRSYLVNILLLMFNSKGFVKVSIQAGMDLFWSFYQRCLLGRNYRCLLVSSISRGIQLRLVCYELLGLHWFLPVCSVDRYFCDRRLWMHCLLEESCYQNRRSYHNADCHYCRNGSCPCSSCYHWHLVIKRNFFQGQF